MPNTTQTSMLPGVSLTHNRLRYKAKGHRGKSIYLGTYNTPEEAHEAYVRFNSEYPPGVPGPERKEKVRNIPNSFTPTPKKEDPYANLRAAWYNL